MGHGKGMWVCFSVTHVTFPGRHGWAAVRRRRKQETEERVAERMRAGRAFRSPDLRSSAASSGCSEASSPQHKAQAAEQLPRWLLVIIIWGGSL